MDDAGIVYAYARNFAHGHGWVSQPGMPPVEGFSDFLWVALLAGFNAIGLFHLVWIPKLLGLSFTAFTYVTASRFLIVRMRLPWYAAAMALGMLSLQAAFVIWSMSGLENPLFVFLIVSLFSLLASRSIEELRVSPAAATSIGLIAGLIAMTRPDGIVYAAAMPVVVGVAALRHGRGARRLSVPLVVYGFCVLAIVGGQFLFRWTYFHDIVPNTVRAKGGVGLPEVYHYLSLQPAQFLKLLDLVRSAAGKGGAWVVLAGVGGTAYYTAKGRITFPMWVSLLFLGISTSVYMLLPFDWMGEYRFATPFYPFFFLCLTVLLALFFRDEAASLRARVAVALGCVAMGVVSADSNVRRTRNLARVPPIALDYVRSYARHLDGCAALLGPPDRYSALVPDLGGMLLESRMRVYDMGMLCDRKIARTLLADNDAFRDYVFEEMRPTFIHSYDYWGSVARLSEDPRFRRDYVQVPTRPLSLYPNFMAGQFVRRDALSDNPALLHRMTKVLEEPR